MNNHDLQAVLDSFTDDAAIRIEPPPLVETINEAAVRERRISSLTITFAPEDMDALQRATAARGVV